MKQQILRQLKRQILSSLPLALGALMLVAQDGQAQVVSDCTPELAGGTQVTPTVAHVGNTITVLGVKAGTSGGDCDLVNVSAWLVDPNNSSQLVFTNGAIPSGSCASCPSGFSSCIGTEDCIPGVNFTYVVSASDINQPLSFTPPGGLGTASQSAIPHYIQFMPVATGIVPPGGNESGNNVKGQGQAKVLIVTPSISVTKSCASNCTPYGAPIVFNGTVCNTGDDTLIGVSVTDNPTAIITFSTTTSYGTNGFPATGGGRLLPGECVNFTGSYQPTNNFCGPFTDTVVASGTESSTGPFEFQSGVGIFQLTNTLTVFATNSATCTVCINPCLTVTKNCATAIAGQPQLISGVVSNCGNVPLTNIAVVDNIIGTITNIALLTNGQGVAYSTTITASCGTNTDYVTASGFTACGAPISASATNNCVGTESPCITVTKTCTTAVVGQPQTISGAVTNCGNVTLTNIAVADNVVGSITNVSSLAPGAFFFYSKTVTATCGGNTNVVTASGTSVPCGTVVAARATNTCVTTESPCVSVTSTCTSAVVGSIQTISGTVTNCGNDIISNIVVSDSLLGSITNFTTLAPSAGFSFSATLTAVCGGNTNIITASAVSQCGTPVSAMSTNTCVTTESPCITVTKTCTTAVVGQPQTISGAVTNCGNVTLTNISVSDNVVGSITNGVTLAPGAFFFYSKTVTAVCGGNTNIVTASGVSFPCLTAVSAKATNTCVTTESPCIGVTSACSTAVVGGTQFITGTVTNCGNDILSNIVVSDSLLGSITNFASLAPGGFFSYSNALTAVCGGNSNVVTASAISQCGTPVSASSTNTCVTTESPCITVTKTCTTAIVGQPQTISGAVTNCGNVALTNISVSDNIVGSITNVSLLPAGGFFFYSKTVTAVCGGNTNIVTASAVSFPCLTPVSAKATNTCVTTESPCITVTKTCTTAVVGQPQTISGAVTNCGNDILTNITVVDNVVGSITNVSTLAPGGFFFYSKTVTATCGGNTNVVTASAISQCGTPVSAMATNTCVTTESPCITVVGSCSSSVVGGLQFISGAVTNCGNVTLTNVTLTDSLIGSITNVPLLAPGGSFVFTNAITAVCGGNTNIVTASGVSICGTPVSAKETNVCVATESPCITVTKTCTTAVVGQPQTVSGAVTNCGNVTLTNISVTDNVIGSITNGVTLTPGSFFFYSKTVTAVCGGNTNIVTASGVSTCGTPVSAMATNTCVVTESPCITVTKTCTTAVVGQPQTISGAVTNCGNDILTNITVVDNVVGSITNVSSLAPGGFFFYSKTVTATCGGNTNVVTASAISQCGTPVSAMATNTCVTTESPCITVVGSCSSSVVGGLQFISGAVTNCGNVTLTNVTLTDSLIGSITNVPLLAPGGSFVFTNAITAVCGGNINIVTASGVSICGTAVSAKETNVCVATESPCITVSKTCTTAVVGQPQTVSGAVTNCGNVTLTNISVTDNIIGSITNGVTLTPGGFFFYSKTVTAVCGGNTNVVTAVGVSICGTPVTAMATNTCIVTESPCIALTANCNSNFSGGLQIVSGTVTNCGNVTLTNVTLNDSVYGSITGPFPLTLAPGAGRFYAITNTAVCPGNTNFVTVSAISPCGTVVTASATNTCVAVCLPPNVGITKQVACFLGTNAPAAPLSSTPTSDEFCGVFSNSAVGISSATQNPAFCYTITVTNPGPVALTNVSIIDTNPASGMGFGDLTADFPCVTPVFAVGASCSYTFKAELTGDLTNIVNITGYSIVSGQPVTTNASAVVTIYPASISCLKQYTIDGGPLTNNAKLSDQNTHTIVWYVTVSNPSTNVNLGDVVVTDVTTNLGCSITLPPFSLAAGSNVIFALCTNNDVAATNGSFAISDTISVTADEFSLGTNDMPVCAHDITGSNIVVSSECEAMLTVTAPGACRVTGGGRQDAPNVYPANVRYITHGGQVGAPVGDRICVVTTQFPIGNPCIHGRWTHVRHMQGGLEGNFHARFYDTLQCACLDTTTTPGVVMLSGIDGATAQTYTNLVYGPGTTVDAICNPGDKISGPLPSPAPANKMTFTGVGDYALTQGNRVPVSVLFRVDIEDRGEPGNSHAIGSGNSNSKNGRIPDRNRTRIWILTPTELLELRGGGVDPLLLNFRNAISACNGINVQDGATVPNGTAAFGVRPPDIDDGGELDHGNYQIHPSIMSCDPNNPTGPGLAKP